jgi:hypothetical protein
MRRHDGRTGEKTDDHPSGANGLNTRHDRRALKAAVDKGVITDEEFKEKLREERTTYQTILKSIEQ